MKLKSYFYIYNCLSLFIIFCIFSLPIFILGLDRAIVLIKSIWYIPATFVCVVIYFNLFYHKNKNIYQSIEDENWKKVMESLDELFDKRNSLIFRKKPASLTKSRLKLYIHTCYVTGSIQKLISFEALARNACPGWMKEFVLSFGMLRFVMQTPNEVENYFSEFLAISTKDREWVNLLYAITLLLQRKIDESSACFAAMLREPVHNSFHRLLLLYFSAPLFEKDHSMSDEFFEHKQQLSENITFGELEKCCRLNRLAYVKVVFGSTTQKAWHWLHNE